jgi:hypothetical protein
MLCELHYTPIHGKNNQSNFTIEGHYLVIDCFDGATGESILDDSESDSSDSNSSDSSNSDLQLTLEQSVTFYETLNRRLTPHICIRNYFNIISRPDYIKPEIGLQIMLETGELVAIIKTIWIRLIQRAWKRVYKRRQEVINGRKQIASLNCVRLTGLWPPMYRFMPTLAGLLVN